MKWSDEVRLKLPPDEFRDLDSIDRETVNLRNLDKAISDPLWSLADGLRKLSYGDMMKLAKNIDELEGSMADRLFNWATTYIDPPPEPRVPKQIEDHKERRA